MQRQFDAWAASYETGRLARWYQGQALEILPLLKLRQDAKIIDVGCGSGWLLRRLAADRPDIRGVGVDVSANMISTARENAGNAGCTGLAFIQIDWESGLLPDHLSGADVVVCVSAFHYFDDPSRALSRMRRVLRPGGQVLIMERALERSPLTALWDLAHRRLIRDDARFYRSEELLELIEQAGFKRPELTGRIRRLFWRGKLHTSLVIVEAVA